MRRKRKEIRSSENVGFYLSDDFDKARQIKKKCSEHWKVCPAEKVGSCSRGDEKVGSCGGGTAAGVVMTAPASGRSAADSPGRGLKRKLGCVESATRIGRKKKLENEYVLGRQIGKGRFGSVRLCWSKVNGEEFACKTLLKNGEETVHREVEIMQHVSGHPGIVTLKAVFEDSKSFHLVMELCSGGRLMDQMVKEGRYSECRAAILMKELILVIKYCHEMGVVHRDIKPENILLTTSGKMKLSDFGLAVRVACGQKLSGVAGSPAYVAPEVLLGDYSEKVDIWAAGVLLHLLLVGGLPFNGGSLEAVFEAIKKTELDFTCGVWESISELARDLLSRMLTRDVSKRITADEILNHSWILFYTKCPSEVMRRKSVRKNIKPIIDVERIAAAISSTLSIESSSSKSEEQDGCCFVDALAAAMSRVSISETKRTRLCGPVSPIQQQCSSNMESNLCTAF
ncbi:hypothetical protein C4D60_Mb01t10490 [Musa balbisiana]|uniref:Protein kinase domain-containing protein n=1 Tax=Musa balbisiana TaxID=52838 RepID=A0A4S8JM40_MUSBA|nr:hypothetical protein C4D60_Mb01t10490 [Musa balbisiana]